MLVDSRYSRCPGICKYDAARTMMPVADNYIRVYTIRPSSKPVSPTYDALISSCSTCVAMHRIPSLPQYSTHDEVLIWHNYVCATRDHHSPLTLKFTIIMPLSYIKTCSILMITLLCMYDMSSLHGDSFRSPCDAIRLTWRSMRHMTMTLLLSDRSQRHSVISLHDTLTRFIISWEYA